MIPKKLHYCWLSGSEMPGKIKDCMDTWRKIMPDYELVCWDTKRFDIQSNAFVAEACKVKKWAFAADYIRLHAIHTEGGIYLDTDVVVKKRFDEFLNCGFFSAVEYHPAIVENENVGQYLEADGNNKRKGKSIPGIGIQAAVLGGIKGHPYLKDCMAFYQDRHFIKEDGTFNNGELSPGVLAMTAENYGFRYKDERQELRDNMILLPSKIFVGIPKDDSAESYAIHYCVGSWREVSGLKKVKRMLSNSKVGELLKRTLRK